MLLTLYLNAEAEARCWIFALLWKSSHWILRQIYSALGLAAAARDPEGHSTMLSFTAKGTIICIQYPLLQDVPAHSDSTADSLSRTEIDS